MGKSKKRGNRRDQTVRYARRARAVWLAAMCPIGFDDHSVGWFAKGKAIGCRCRRKRKGQPKLGTGCRFGRCFHPCVVERIQGNRDSRAWLRAIQAGVEADDIEL